jgi:hypothetical protein
MAAMIGCGAAGLSVDWWAVGVAGCTSRRGYSVRPSILVLLFVSIIFLSACQWIEPPPNYTDDAFTLGAVNGCILIFVQAAGPPPSIEAYEIVVAQCRKNADYMLAMPAEELPIQLQSEVLPMPTTVPGSTL